MPFLQTLELPLRGPAPSPLATLSRYSGDTPDHTQGKPVKQRSSVGVACPSLSALYTWMQASERQHLPLPHTLLNQLLNISSSGEPEHLPGLRAHSPGQGMGWVGAAFLAFHFQSASGLVSVLLKGYRGGSGCGGERGHEHLSRAWAAAFT